MAFFIYALVGIEEIGLEIEDPFGDDPNDLPIVPLTNGVIKDIQDVLERWFPTPNFQEAQVVTWALPKVSNLHISYSDFSGGFTTW